MKEYGIGDSPIMEKDEEESMLGVVLDAVPEVFFGKRPKYEKKNNGLELIRQSIVSGIFLSSYHRLIHKKLFVNSRG